MNQPTNVDVAKAWINIQNAKEGSEEYEKYFWAFSYLDDLRDEDAERIWKIINEIIDIDASEWVLSNLAAGPVEDLLVDHGEKFINRLEEKVKGDNRFKTIIKGIWKNEIPEPIWKRVQKLVQSP